MNNGTGTPKMPRQRKARLPVVSSPDALIEAEEANIREFAEDWHAERIEMISAKSSHEFLKHTFLECLRRNDGALDYSLLIDLADGGHIPAHEALLDIIDAAFHADRVQELAMGIRDYARRSLRRT